MVQKVRWGVLGTARIALHKVIPAMQQSECCKVVAIGSRDLDRARTAASALGVPTAYGSYEALIADPDIDAIYNPLPNHLHVPWSMRAAEAQKHVLCEKPVALTALEAGQLLAARDRTGVKVQEAFMVRTHPQWRGAVDLIRGGGIGDVRSMVGVFTFFMADSHNIRTVAEYGGGGLMDLGCYLVHTARWVFDREPERVVAAMELDEHTGIDRLASIVLTFGATPTRALPAAYAIGTCSMYQGAYQRVQILGTKGRVEIEIPFNAPLDRTCRIFVGDGSDPTGVAARTIEFDTCNQYTIEVDQFSRAILDGTDVPLPLEDSVKNMRVLDALARSAESGRWERP